jgi:hypothetical protein
MSLPSSEPLPEDINDLPPARQRHIRRLPRSATPAERQILLNSLVGQTVPTLNFFLLTFIGALLLGAALYFNDSALLIAAIIALPCLPPIFGLGLLPTTLKIGSGLKSLICLLISIILTWVAGALAGWLQKEGHLTNMGLIRFSAPYWLDISLVFIGAILGALILLRQGKLPRLIGVLLSYEILAPMATAGFGFVLGSAQLWPSALLTGFLHLTISVFSAIFAFLLLSFFPKKVLGWFLSVLPFALAFGFLGLGLNLYPKEMMIATEASTPPTAIIIPTNSPTVNSTTPPTATEIPATATLPPSPSSSPSFTLAPTQTSTSTPSITPQPTSYWGLVDSLTGAVVRETPDFNADVITYVNDGDIIEILDTVVNEDSTRWFQVRTHSEETGWLLSSLIVTPTPTTTP